MSDNLEKSTVPLQTLSSQGALNDLEANLKNAEILHYRLEWERLNIIKTISEGNVFKPKTSHKQILTNVTGSAEPGELLAIMGPSGGGKTSLLNALSKRAKITSGSITLNGKKVPKNFNKISAYVMQDDRLFEVLTPRELFHFSASLRLPRGTTAAERNAAVEAVIQKLKIQSCADTRVGGALLRGLSGGERKRTSIGYELITNPSLLFLDEPTSGLDSFTSYALLDTLKALAKEGHTIICTIHQPSSDIFNLFDKLNLLVKGKLAYSGPAADSIEFFGSLGYPCPTYTNPCDFFMTLLQTTTEEDFQRTDKFVQATHEKTAKLLQNKEEDKQEEPSAPPPRPPFHIQLAELTKRSWRTSVRNPLTFRAKLFQNIVMSLLVGCVYYNLSYYQIGASDRSGALFFITVSQIMTALNGVLLTFPLERALLIREQSNGMYGVASYFFGKFISGLPLDIFFPLLFSLITYWMVGFTSTAARYFLYLLTLIGVSFTASSMGLLLGCMLPNAEVAISLAPIVIIPFMLFAGFYVSLDTIPVWLSWLQYLSVFKWGFQAFATNEFHDTPYSCTDAELVHIQAGNETLEACPITNGNQVLENLGYQYPRDYWVAIGVIFGLFAGFRILAFGFLHWQTKRSLKKNQ